MVDTITNQNDINHSSVKSQTVVVDTITNQNNMNHSSVKPKAEMVDNIATVTWATPLLNFNQ